MPRQIFLVEAKIVDANGTLSDLANYPKAFDSRNYDGDIVKAQRRAEGDFSECWGTMCKRDDRQIQTVRLTTISGQQLAVKSYGTFPEEENNEEVL